MRFFPARNKKTTKEKPRQATPGERLLLKEVGGILVLALTTLMVVSLLSYRTDDPSWASSGVQHATSSADAPLSTPQVRNLAGTAGAHLADGLLQLFGGCAYLMPPFLLMLGAAALQGGSLRAGWMRVTGWILFFLATPALLDLWTDSVWTVADGRILFGQAGGLVGEGITSALLPYFAQVGTVILLVTLFLLAIVMGPAVTLRSAVRATSAIWTVLQAHLEARRDRRLAAPQENRRKAPPVVRREASAEPMIVEPQEMPPPPAQEALSFMRDTGNYQLPQVSLLDDPPPTAGRAGRDELLASSRVLEKKLADYGVEGKVSQVHPGPVVTMYEFAPAPGIKVSKISALADDLALAMSATRVRIVAPIPGKSVVGIEIPNRNRETIALKELLLSSQFTGGDMHIPIALGKDIFGAPVMADLVDMPHLLVAGSTGSGKSVGLNSMILSIAFSSTPADVRLAMVDPKMLELSVYDGIPHLMHPVITRPKDAVKLFRRMVLEMMRRYQLLQQAGVRNIIGYNDVVETAAFRKKAEQWREEAIDKGETPAEHGKLPYVVVIVDELADLMAVAAKEIEEPITRLAQMARAAGIHLILATQRPSVDVITGLIKANFPSRIAFQVSSKTDSRTILDSNGAEQLLGRGDMLFMGAGSAMMRRIHGAFVSDTEVHKVVEFIKSEQPPEYDPDLLKVDESAAAEAGVPGFGGGGGGADGERDEAYDQAIAIVAETRKASASFLQRRMRVGYPRAARFMELMEEDGIVGPAEGSRPREVLVPRSPGSEPTLQ
ncbi:MAG: DNA translocase FtsK [Leptospirillia bacterium]